MTNFEKKLINALEKERGAFPKPSVNLKRRLYADAPIPIKKIVWRTAVGFAVSFVILVSICVQFENDNYFKPTQKVVLDELSYQTITVTNISNGSVKYCEFQFNEKTNK